MADFYRTNGNAGPAGSMISFIGKQPTPFAIVIQNSSLTKADLRSELGVNLAVPAILNALEGNATVLAYQVENTNTGNISVLLEGGNQLTATNIQTILQAASPFGNNSVDGGGTAVFSTGFKIATS